MSLDIVNSIHDALITRQFDPNKDPRVGSGRDGAESPSGTRVLTGGENTSSYRALFVTWAPILVFSVVCLSVFWVLRRRYPRVYAPRTILNSLEPHERSKPLPLNWFGWVKDFYNVSDNEVICRASLDSFFFLRYLKLLCVITLFGVVLTWSTLLPLHHYGGKGLKELDALTFGNIANVQWCFIHAIEAWIFFGFILYLISRECIYFISVRQAYLFSPYYANRLSSRTVLFSCVPGDIQSDKKIRMIFGDSVKNVWIPREAEDLDKLVEEREQTANRLEKAELLLIRKANKAYRKDLKAGLIPSIHSQDVDEKPLDVSISSDGSVSPTSTKSPNPQTIQTNTLLTTPPGAPRAPPDVNGSVAAQWIPAENRPRHRPLANYGRRVDTIKWTRDRLKMLAPKISKLRRQYRKGEGLAIPAVFVEFHTQVDAQAAYQTLAHHRANQMEPEIIGVRPHEIIWPSLYMSWMQRIVRRFLVQGFVTVMVIFWAIPAALAGFISNIKFLVKIPILSWLQYLPNVLLDLISGVLPALALMWLMSLVPGILRFCAREAGITTESRVELFVQSSYFIFQVVQVFLITTVTSAASGVLQQLIKDPMQIRSLLADNLPKASNFYISYFLLQGFFMSAVRIVHLGSLVRNVMMAHVGGPRMISKRYHHLRKMHWGTAYPIFTNMGVIAISYTFIAPVVLGVALIAFFLIYITFRYNIMYIYSAERDARGLHYPSALKQTLTGVYIAELCMLGLFGVKGAYYPMILMIGLLVLTYLVNFSISRSLAPLLYSLPRTLAAEEELRKAGHHPSNAEHLEDGSEDPQAALEQQQHDHVYDSDFDPSDPADQAVSHGEQNSRGLRDVEGADNAVDVGRDTIRKFVRKKYEASSIPSFISTINFWSYWTSPSPTQKSNLILKFLHPHIFENYHTIRDKISQEILDIDISYEEGVLKDAYSPASVRNKSPKIWLPQDPAGVSAQEIRHCSKVIECSNADAWLDEKGFVDVNFEGETERWVLRDYERVRF